jgi:hypothetical protein
MGGESKLSISLHVFALAFSLSSPEGDLLLPHPEGDLLLPLLLLLGVKFQ